MKRAKHGQHNRLQVQRDTSSLSKYSYRKGDGHQEVSEQKVSMIESAVRKSVMSHPLYRKQGEGEIVTLPPCQGLKTATSLAIPVVVSTILDKRFDVHVMHRSLVEPGQNVVNVGRRVSNGRVWRRWSSCCLELAVEVIMDVNHCLVVSDMPKTLTK